MRGVNKTLEGQFWGQKWHSKLSKYRILGLLFVNSSYIVWSDGKQRKRIKTRGASPAPLFLALSLHLGDITLKNPLHNKGEYSMRRMTLLLFQLFLALFAGYAIIYDVPNKYLLVPLLCLLAMLFLGKHPQASPEIEKGEQIPDHVSYPSSPQN